MRAICVCRGTILVLVERAKGQNDRVMLKLVNNLVLLQLQTDQIGRWNRGGTTKKETPALGRGRKPIRQDSLPSPGEDHTLAPRTIHHCTKACIRQVIL